MATVRNQSLASKDIIARNKSIPDWNAPAERDIITQMVREHTKYFKGIATTCPLYLGTGSIARYRINFHTCAKPIDFSIDRAARSSLASAFVIIKWSNCSSGTESCWEPELLNLNFKHFKTAKFSIV